MKIRDAYYNKKQRDKFYEEISKESPRAAAILGCAYIDNLLNALLKVRLIKDEELFENSIARLTCERRMNLCYLIGLINNNEWRDLKTINKIRNQFAHDINLNSFNKNTKSLDIPSKLDNLNYIKERKKRGDLLFDSREKYIIAVSFYMGLLVALLEKCPRIKLRDF